MLLYNWEIINLFNIWHNSFKSRTSPPPPNCGHQHGSHTNYAQRHKVITNVQNIIWFRQRCLLEKIQII